MELYVFVSKKKLKTALENKACKIRFSVLPCAKCDSPAE